MKALLGLVDMCGNVWEWTGSLYCDYPFVDISTKQMLILPDIIFRQPWWKGDCTFTMRGGSWGVDKNYSTNYSRIWSSAFNRGIYGGFRLALSGKREETEDYCRYTYELNTFAEIELRDFFMYGKIENGHFVSDKWWITVERLFLESSCSSGYHWQPTTSIIIPK